MVVGLIGLYRLLTVDQIGSCAGQGIGMAGRACGRLTTVLAGILAAPRAVAQLGSALDWGSSGRRFKSCQPDQS